MTGAESAKFAANIPTITALRDALLYGDGRLPRCNAFNDTLLVFRKNYITSAGLRGSEIHDWKSDEHQAALTEMSQAFLDRDKNGELFWPTDPASPNFNALKYSTQQPLIRSLVKQLIYRLNVQQHRNAKYKRKGQRREDDHDTAPQHAYPSIEISSDEAHTPRGATAARTNTTIQPNTNERHDVTVGYSQPGQIYKTIAPDEDGDYVVDLEPTKIGHLPRRKPREERSANPLKRAKPPSPRKPMKRAHVENGGHSSLTAVTWTSPRGPKTIRCTERAPTDELNNAITSPAYSPTAGTYRQSTEDFIEFIRNNRPSVTSERSMDVESLRNPQHSRKALPIDPALERLVPVYATSRYGRVDELSSVPTHEAEYAAQGSQKTTSTPSIPQHLSGSPHLRRNTQPETSAHEDTPQPKLDPASSPRPNLEITYLIISARKPIYKYSKIKLNGNFQDKSLAELISELPTQKNYEVLILRLRGPDTLVEESVKCDREGEFADVKRRFNKVVRSLVLNQARTNPGETLLIGIEIEPLRSEEDVQDDDEDELEDFAW